jgi:hypothetical protein
MFTHLRPESSRLFTPWKDPASGVTSYILNARCAAWQQAFYFTNPNVTTDGRYLWLYCSNPPTPSHILGVVDLKEQTVTAFPETGFQAESPYIDPRTGEAYWTSGESIYCRAPAPERTTQEVGQVPAHLFGERLITQVSTHLTLSADGKYFNLDIKTGDRWHLGVMEKATGAFHLWQTFDEHVNHSQFNPVRPGLMMFAHDWWKDLKTGERYAWKNRIWLIREEQKAAPLFAAESGKNVLRHCHEWWSADGKGVWFVDYDHGTEYYDLDSGEHINAWSGGTCHSHASRDGQLLVGDINTYNPTPEKPRKVAFFNRQTGKETNIVTAFPPQIARRAYHPDPHPQFILDDEFIAYTTWVLGRLDFALVRVAELL